MGHLLGQCFIVLWSTYFYLAILTLFIPITGKSGGENQNPDALIALICGFISVLACSYFVRYKFKLFFLAIVNFFSF